MLSKLRKNKSLEHSLIFTKYDSSYNKYKSKLKTNNDTQGINSPYISKSLMHNDGNNDNKALSTIEKNLVSKTIDMDNNPKIKNTAYSIYSNYHNLKENKCPKPRNTPFLNKTWNDADSISTSISNTTKKAHKTFHDLVCKNCYKISEANRLNKKNNNNKSFSLYEQNPKKDKLNNAFISQNLYSFQDKMNNYANNKIKDKVKNNLKRSTSAFNHLQKVKDSESVPKEELQKINQYSIYKGLDGDKDPRYKRLKEKYDNKERILNKNLNMYKIDSPRKAIKDYYNKCMYSIPLLEPENNIDNEYKKNFINYLKNQIENKKLKERAEKYNADICEYKANKNYPKIYENQIKYDDFQKKEMEKSASDQNRSEILNHIKKNQSDYLSNKKNNEKLMKEQNNELANIDNRRKDNRKVENEVVDSYMKLKNKRKDRVNSQDKNDVKKWKNYSEEFVVNCIHGINLYKCSICNRFYPKKNLLKINKKFM